MRILCALRDDVDGGGGRLGSVVDDRGLAWTVRAGVGYLFERLHIGTQVVTYGFARGGFAIEPFCLVAGASW